METELVHISPKGEGYFCKVSKYKSKVNGKFYAVKYLKKRFYAVDDYKYRMKREIDILKQLANCESAIDLISHGVVEEKNTIYYVMPFADQSLYDYIKKNNSNISLEERYLLSKQVLDGIKCAHDKGILHRDISPLNVLVFKDEGAIKLRISDYGLGKNTASLSHYSSSEAKGYGQILYVSPEQRLKLKDADFRSDIYSLGKLLYFIFTGKDPDNRTNTEIDSLVSKSTEDKPENRHQNIDELIFHFESIIGLQDKVDIPIESMSLMDLDLTEEFDPTLFHRIISNDHLVSHAFDDYFYYVLKILDSKEKIATYYKSVGSSIKKFVKITNNHIETCLGQYGWEFKQTDNFGKLLYRVALVVDEDDIKILSIKMMYELAFRHDQWAVQRNIKDFLNSYEMPPEIATQFAEYILSSKICIDNAHLRELNVPGVVRNSVRRVLMEECK